MQVTAKSNIKHNGQRFTAGQTLEVSEEQAAKLLAAGVIESVKGLKPEAPEEAPDRSMDTPEDKNSIDAETEAVANLPVTEKMKKEKLRGIALAMGLEVDKTMTGKEIYALIVEKRGEGSVEAPVEEVKEESTEDADAETEDAPVEDAPAEETPAK